MIVTAQSPARSRIAWLALAALLAVAGCAAKDVLSTDEAGYVADVDRRIASIDWDTAETVDLALTEFRYAPPTLHFVRGKPYRLHLINRGIEAHDITSKAFYQAIAVAKLVGPDGTVTTPHLVTVGVDPGETKDLYFVPVGAGTYSFECDEPLHARFGMRGVAEIQ